MALLPSAAGSFRRTMSKPPLRVQITDPQRTGYQHAGQTGTAVWGSCTGGRSVQIRLDNGPIIYGTDCWWVEIFDRPVTEVEAAAILDLSPATRPWQLIHLSTGVVRGRFRTRQAGLRARRFDGHSITCCLVSLAD